MESYPNRRSIREAQLDKLNILLGAMRESNMFYKAKYRAAAAPMLVTSLEQFAEMFPFTTKEELAADQAGRPPYGSNLTFDMAHYARCHQTSGTTGTPLRWLDTRDSWDWMLRNWELVYRTAGVTARDRVFCAFSFGPFLGFWLAFEAAARLGCLTIPGGGLSSSSRLRMIFDNRITVLCATPTYALRLAEVAVEEKVDLSQSNVRLLVVAGEAGGSVPAVRQRLEEAWPGARVYDHHGMTEVGPVTYECPDHPGVLHVIESGYIPEIIEPGGTQAVAAGQPGELVLTTLGRTGSPLLRYRTGDLVQAIAEESCSCGRSDLALQGGILGRTDDMVVVRGVNVYPSSLEGIVHACGGVGEFVVRTRTEHSMVELMLEVEPASDAEDPQSLAARLSRLLEAQLALRVPVRCVPPGTLPRYEMKSRRWIRE